MTGRVAIRWRCCALCRRRLRPSIRPNAWWPQHQIEHDFPLPHVARALAAKHLDILVVGAGSSALPGPNGAKIAYPARLQNALTEKLPGVTVNVSTDVKARAPPATW